LSGFQVTPPAFQVNEGDSLTTSLSGFTPGSTLYFRVTGRGISKKDFAAGAVKGSLKVDANGVASISHTLKADKVTEGAESFTIQVFSDKKMRNLLGQSDAVTVVDTSVKAVKTPKGGPAKAPKNSIDKNTGRFIEFDDGIKLFSGQTYTHDSITGQKLLRYGQNALATYCNKPSCINDDDIRLANQEEDPVTGYRSLDALPPGATYSWNFQVNETYFVLTGQYTNGDVKTTSRVVYKGENTFEGNKLVRYQPRLDANVYVNGHAPGKAYSGSVKEVSGRTFSAPFTFRGSDKGGIGTSRQISAYNSSTKFASATEMTAHLNFENGKFFYNGWDANISANLL